MLLIKPGTGQGGQKTKQKNIQFFKNIEGGQNLRQEINHCEYSWDAKEGDG